VTARFYAYLEQESGCDYTIACGKELIAIDGANSPDEALAWILDKYGYYFDSKSENPFSSVKILDVAFVESVDLKAIADRRSAARAVEEAAKKEAAERAEFERLKEKFK
jgi:hypothetical protein